MVWAADSGQQTTGLGLSGLQATICSQSSALAACVARRHQEALHSHRRPQEAAAPRQASAENVISDELANVLADSLNADCALPLPEHPSQAAKPASAVPLASPQKQKSPMPAHPRELLGLASVSEEQQLVAVPEAEQKFASAFLAAAMQGEIFCAVPEPLK